MHLLLSTLSFFHLILFGVSTCWAGQSYLDILKAGRFSYEIDSRCSHFLETIEHGSFFSKRIRDASIPLRGLDYGATFFHYSQDKGSYLRNAVKRGSIESVLAYTFSYKDAFNNSAGPGFYLAANPFSSSNYGHFQFALEVNLGARVYDYEGDGILIWEELLELDKRFPEFKFCEASLKLNLVLSENMVDLVLYNKTNEWFVLLNSDAVKGIKFTRMVKDPYDSEIIDMMFASSTHEALASLLSEAQASRSHKYDLKDLLRTNTQDERAHRIISLAKGVENWTTSLRHAFAVEISRFNQPLLNTLVTHQTLAMIGFETYLKVNGTLATEDFRSWIARVERDIPKTF